MLASCWTLFSRAVSVLVGKGARHAAAHCLILVILALFGGGLYSKGPYRGSGIGLGTVLLIILVLWLLGVFGMRPF